MYRTLFSFKVFFIVYVCVPTCKYVHHVSACYRWKSEKFFKSPGCGVADTYEPTCGFWELNLGPLQKQSVLLTPEPTFYSHLVSFEKEFIL